MSSIYPLGFKFNIGRNASAGSVRASFRDCSVYSFVVDTPGSASNWTISEANAATGGTSQPIGTSSATTAPAPFYYSQASTGLWTRTAIVVGGNYVASTGVLTFAAATPDNIVLMINQGALSDGFGYITVAHNAKATTYVACELDVERAPLNLRGLYA